MTTETNWPFDDPYIRTCLAYRNLGYPPPTREWWDAAIAKAKRPTPRSDIQADYDYYRREMGD